MVGERVDS